MLYNWKREYTHWVWGRLNIYVVIYPLACRICAILFSVCGFAYIDEKLYLKGQRPFVGGENKI